MDNEKKKIFKTLDEFQYLKDPKEAFSDAVEFNALMLSVKTDAYRIDERISRAMDIYNSYKGENFEKFGKLSDGIYNLLSGMLDNFGDHLGEIYMEICGNKNSSGQYFTPYYISKFMAEIALGETSENKIVTLSEPTCGSGAMVVAAADVWTKRGFNYANNALAVANDVDRICVYMSYLQISFTGMPAVVKHQNTLTQECWDTFITPAFALQYPKFKRIYDSLEM